MTWRLKPHAFNVLPCGHGYVVKIQAGRSTYASLEIFPTIEKAQAWGERSMLEGAELPDEMPR